MPLPLPALDARELARTQAAVAIKDPDHLIRFLQGSDRTFLVFHAPTLVRGLPWPAGVDALLQVVAAYNSERCLDPTGYVTDEKTLTGEAITAPVNKDDRLFLDEIDDAILQLKRLKKTHLQELAAKAARLG